SGLRGCVLDTAPLPAGTHHDARRVARPAPQLSNCVRLTRTYSDELAGRIVYSPRNTGERFSARARRPSLRSSAAHTSSNPTRNAFSSGSGSPSEFSTRLL